MKKFFNAFPDIEIPAILQRFSFEDQSWGNESCARAVRNMEDGSVLVVWVEYEDKERREFGPKAFRYVVEVQDSEDSYGIPEETRIELETNSDIELSDRIITMVNNDSRGRDRI